MGSMLRKLRIKHIILICLIANIIMPLFAKRLQAYNAIINTVDIYSYKSIIQDKQTNNAVDELAMCNHNNPFATVSDQEDSCSLFDERFERFETETELIFVSRVDFFPTRIDVTFDRTEDFEKTVSAFVCINNTLVPEFSYLLHSVEYHFHKDVEHYTIPKFIDVQHHVHVSEDIYQRHANNKNEPILNITIGPDPSKAPKGLTSRYPTIDFLTALKRSGINTFNQLPINLVVSLNTKIKSLLSSIGVEKDKSEILSEWIAMLISPVWGESGVIALHPNAVHQHTTSRRLDNMLNDFNFQIAYTLLLLGRLSDVSHTTLFRCPSVYFMSEGRVLEGGYIWVVVAANCLVFYHSLRILFGAKAWLGLLCIVVLMAVGFARPLFFISVSFKVLVPVAVAAVVMSERPTTTRRTKAKAPCAPGEKTDEGTPAAGHAVGIGV